MDVYFIVIRKKKHLYVVQIARYQLLLPIRACTFFQWLITFGSDGSDHIVIKKTKEKIENKFLKQKAFGKKYPWWRHGYIYFATFPGSGGNPLERWQHFIRILSNYNDCNLVTLLLFIKLF